MPPMLARAMSTLLCLTIVHHVAPGPLASQAPLPVEIQRGDWEVALQLGLTSFGVDASTPGSMTILGLGRHLTERWSLALEGGLGSIQTTEACNLAGTGSYRCAGTGTWPTLGLGTRFVVFQDEGSASRAYTIAQVVAHGPDLVASYDLGFGVSWRAIVGIDVGIELRHRFGYDGASGGMYMFRISH